MPAIVAISLPGSIGGRPTVPSLLVYLLLFKARVSAIQGPVVATALVWRFVSLEITIAIVRLIAVTIPRSIQGQSRHCKDYYSKADSFQNI